MNEHQEWLTQAFRPRLKQHLERVQATEAMYYATSSGKRIRPLLVYDAARAWKSALEPEEEEAVLDCACALECVHAYSLVHDDLPAMDNDVLRRGMPTVHVAFGEAEAILCGDALLNLAFEILMMAIQNASPRMAPRLAQAGVILSEASGIRGMIGGQILDMNPALPAEQILPMVQGKTAALFRAACGMGCVLTGASAEEVLHARRFGEALGILFQLTDDLSDEEEDVAQGKITYLGYLGQNTRKEMDALSATAKAESSNAENPERIEAWIHRLYQT